MAVLLSGDGMRGEQGGSRETGQRDPPAPWVAFVGALPRRFAPPITTVPAEGPSAEWFDRSLPRHPPEGRTWRLSYTTATPLSSCRHTPSGKRVEVREPLLLYQFPQRRVETLKTLAYFGDADGLASGFSTLSSLTTSRTPLARRATRSASNLSSGVGTLP